MSKLVGRRSAAVALAFGALLTTGCKRSHGRVEPSATTDDTASDTKAKAIDGVSDDAIKLVQISVLSGAVAGTGTEVYRGAMAYFLEINSRGGIHGRKVEIVPIDDKYSVEGATQATERAVNDEQGLLVFGNTGTETTGAILTTLKKYEAKKMFLWGSTSGADVSREGPLAPFAFNLRGSLKGAGRDVLGAFATAGLKKIGIVAQDDAFGKSGSAVVREAAAATGMTVVMEVSIAKTAKPDTANADDQVAKLRAAGAEGIVLATVYNPASVFIRDAREKGWNVPIAMTGTPDTALRFLVAHEKKTGKRMTNAVLACTSAPPVNATNLPTVREYRELMDKRNPRLPSEYADPNYRPLRYSTNSLEAFLMARTLGEALERAGRNLTRDSLRAAAETIRNWDAGVGQPVNFGPRDNQGFDGIWLNGIEHDEFTLVNDMKAYLTAKPEKVVVEKPQKADKPEKADKPAGSAKR